MLVLPNDVMWNVKGVSPFLVTRSFWIIQCQILQLLQKTEIFYLSYCYFTTIRLLSHVLYMYSLWCCTMLLLLNYNQILWFWSSARTKYTMYVSVQSVPRIQNCVCLHTRFSFTYSWIVVMTASSLAFINKCFKILLLWIHVTCNTISEGTYLTYVLPAHRILHVADACFLMTMINKTKPASFEIWGSYGGKDQITVFFDR